MKRKFITLLLSSIALTFSFTVFAFVPLDFSPQQQINFKLDQTGTGLSKNLENAAEQQFRKGERPIFVNRLENNGIELRATNEERFSLPYFEDFERRIGNNLADFGYTVVNYEYITRGVGHLVGNDGRPISGVLGSLSYAFFIPTESANPDMWIISSGFELQAGVEYSFEMYAFVPGYRGNFDEFRVAIGRDASPSALTRVIVNYTGSNARSLLWDRVRVIFTAQETGIHYFGIHYRTPTRGGYNALAFDNIALYQMSATPEVRANIFAPIFPYTISPEFLAVPAVDVVRVAVENRSRNALTDLNATIRVEKNQSEFFSRTSSRFGVLAFDANLAMLQTAQPIVFDKPSSATTPDVYKISVDITSVGGFSQTVSADFKSPLLSSNLYARDNGILTWGHGQENTLALFGMAFNFENRVKLNSAIFKLDYPVGSGTQHSQVLVWQVLNEGGMIENIGGSQMFDLLPLIEDYEERLYRYIRNELGEIINGVDLVLEPGLYFITITQPKVEGVRLGLFGTTTVSSGVTGVFNIGAGFEFLDEVFYLRLIVSDPDSPSNVPSVRTNKTNVFSTAYSFELSYTSDFTSVTIFNTSGQMVAAYELPATGQFSIPNHDLARGVYIVRFTGGMTETVKVIR